jgi:hypothetical protein
MTASERVGRMVFFPETDLRQIGASCHKTEIQRATMALF